MGRNLGNLLWGLIFIVVGVVLAGNVFNFWHAIFVLRRLVDFIYNNTVCFQHVSGWR